jgi:transcription antitermination protein NusB
MQARRAARELALICLFQLEQNTQGALPEKLPAQAVLEELMYKAVGVLVDEAKSKLEDAAAVFQEMSHAIADYQFDHPKNLNTPIGSPVQSVEMPMTQRTREQLDQCLHAVELLWETLQTPHLSEHCHNPVVRSFALELLALVFKHQAEIDALINQHSQEWKLERMVKMDRSLLRLALAELCWMRAIDCSVTINEAVEMAKVFSMEESYRFINGLLGHVASARGLVPDAKVTGNAHTEPVVN